MRRIRFEKERATGAQGVDLGPVPIVDRPFQHEDRFYAFVLKGLKGVGLRCENNQVRLNDDTACICADMTKEVVLMPGPCAGAVDGNALTGRCVHGLALSPKPRKNDVSGTDSAFASVCNVVSEGEVLPFSILESIPTEIAVCFDRSATVMFCCLRKARNSRPMATSSTFSSFSVVRCGFCVSLVKVHPFNDT